MLKELTHTFIGYLYTISHIIPLPWFAFLGSVIEEIIAPIPSPLVMTLAGSLAGSQNQKWIFLILLAITGSVGKTIASILMYIIADKTEDIVLNKFGKFIGITHHQVESIGRHLNKGSRDDIVLFLLRAIPIIPTAPISIICGLIKVNVRTYITSTLLGTFVRNVFYLAVGYTGISATEALIVRLEDFEIVGYIIFALFVLASIGYLYYQRHKETILHRIFSTKKDTDAS